MKESSLKLCGSTLQKAMDGGFRVSARFEGAPSLGQLLKAAVKKTAEGVCGAVVEILGKLRKKGSQADS